MLFLVACFVTDDKVRDDLLFVDLGLNIFNYHINKKSTGDFGYLLHDSFECATGHYNRKFCDDTFRTSSCRKKNTTIFADNRNRSQGME